MKIKHIPNIESFVKKAIGTTGSSYMFSVIHRAIALAGNTSIGLVLTFVDPDELKNHPQKLLLSNPRMTPAPASFQEQRPLYGLSIHKLEGSTFSPLKFRDVGEEKKTTSKDGVKLISKLIKVYADMHESKSKPDIIDNLISQKLNEALSKPKVKHLPGFIAGVHKDWGSEASNWIRRKIEEAVNEVGNTDPKFGYTDELFVVFTEYDYMLEDQKVTANTWKRPAGVKADMQNYKTNGGPTKLGGPQMNQRVPFEFFVVNVVWKDDLKAKGLQPKVGSRSLQRINGYDGYLKVQTVAAHITV